MNGATNVPRNGANGHHHAHAHGAHQGKANGSWNVDLFHCSPSGSVINSICQPCVLFGRAEERLRNPYLENYDGTNDECKQFAKNACLCGPMGWIYVKRQRERLRQMYGIPGSSAGDCATATFCCCCALIQHDNEIESRNPKQRGKVDTAGYQANTNSMFMPAADRGSWYMSADARTSQYNR